MILPPPAPLEIKLPTVALPVTDNVVSVPILVTLGCAAVVNVPVNNVPITFPPVILPVAVIMPAVPILPILALPVTDNDASVPVLVIFG